MNTDAADYAPTSLNSIKQETIPFPSSLSEKKSGCSDKSSKLHVQLSNQKKLCFNQITTLGDGWCALNAVYMSIKDKLRHLHDKDKASAIFVSSLLENSDTFATLISNLANHLNDSVVVECIARALESNYRNRESEPFDMERKDSNGLHIPTRISELDQACINSENDEKVKNSGIFHAFLRRPDVLKAYIAYISHQRYADSNIAEACLRMICLDKKNPHQIQWQLCTFRDSRSTNRRLINLSADNRDPEDIHSICIMHTPGSSMGSSHYSGLSLLQSLTNQSTSTLFQQPSAVSKSSPANPSQLTPLLNGPS